MSRDSCLKLNKFGLDHATSTAISLIGNGHVARHFQYYFSLLQLSFTTWHRKESVAKLQQELTRSSHILLLISDSAIEEFIQQHLKT